MVQTRSQASKKHTLPVLLWPPNLIGYLRVVTLAAAMLAPNAASSYAVWMVTASYALDYIDGPCARRMDMCSQFGDLLDHYTDHMTMMWLVWAVTGGGVWAQINLAISAIHNGIAFVYMAVTGHYFKHSATGNVVTRNIEANNYWNLLSLLYCANTTLLPLVKLSMADTHSMKPADATTPLIDTADVLGGLVTLAYSIAVWF